MLGDEDLVLCAGTLPQATLPEKIRAAGEAGYRGLSLYYHDYTKARAAGVSDVDLRHMLDDAGVELAELDPLMDWLPGQHPAVPGVEAGAEFFGTTEDQFYAVADTFGARSLNVILMAPRPPEAPVIAEAFGALCDRAAAHDLLVHLEFLPWTPVRDLAGAAEIARLADRPNAGVMFDTWHHFRSGAANEEISRVPGSAILAIQLNDAPAEAEPDPVAETLNRRRLPGEGDIDLTDVIARLIATGTSAPMGVEIFSESLARLDPVEAAQRAARAARMAIEKARSEQI